MTDSLDRFMGKVAVKGPDDCWEWEAGKRLGYGLFWKDGKTKGAHRAAWEFVHGEIPDNLHVLHKCDNPGCVNVNHLFLGTHADNIADMHNKRRGIYGESNHMAKLTKAKANRIRHLYIPYDRTFGQRPLARCYGVSSKTIRNIINNKIWRHA